MVKIYEIYVDDPQAIITYSSLRDYKVTGHIKYVAQGIVHSHSRE